VIATPTGTLEILQEPLEVLNGFPM
jgi:hypothetical protein